MSWQKQLLAALWLTPLLALGAPSIGGKRSGKCEPITVPLCTNMQYSLTSMPNHLLMDSQDEATAELTQFKSLVHVNCSAELQFFLCSMYTPICIPNYEKAIPPCRAVCERVKSGCLPLMREYGFSWPERMACELWPEESTDDQLCMDPAADRAREEAKRRQENELRAKEELYRSIKNIKVIHDVPSKSASLGEQRGERCDNPVPEGHVYDVLDLTYGGESDCATPCRMYSALSNEGEIADVVIASLTLVCMIFSCVAFVVMAANYKRYSYPERPVLFFSLCYIFIALGKSRL